MTAPTVSPSLSDLEYIEYLDGNGRINQELQKTIGVYAIFDRHKQLQFVGFSRDIYLSLKQHLVRQPQTCYWLKVKAIDRLSRKVLEEIVAAWIAENGATPMGNGEAKAIWTQPIDTKPNMTEEEKAQYQENDELGRAKILKRVARRVEAEVKQRLSERGVTMDIRFNPKLKERGLLDLK
ncbi:GIY-YIG nuclease family protein [Myxosarcina sp. GI1(2024)]